MCFFFNYSKYKNKNKILKIKEKLIIRLIATYFNLNKAYKFHLLHFHSKNHYSLPIIFKPRTILAETVIN